MHAVFTRSGFGRSYTAVKTVKGFGHFTSRSFVLCIEGYMKIYGSKVCYIRDVRIERILESYGR